MKFSTKEDIQMPMGDVFTALSDFDSFERIAIRLGSEVTRVDDQPEIGVGLAWEAKTVFRGKRREFDILLSDYDTPNAMAFDAESPGVSSRLTLELVALSRTRTRLRVELEIRPKTLSARLIMQSAKLARNTLNKRYKTRVSHFCRDMEEQYKHPLRA